MAITKFKDNRPPWEIKKQEKRKSSGNLEFKKIFKIYCEGENTEPEYFKSFPIATNNYKVESIGFGMSKTVLIQKVIDLNKNLKGKKIIEEIFEFDITQVWCVFDMDISYDKKDSLISDFENAIKLAHKNGINVAYSNDSFELWFVLHDKLIESQVTRKEFYEHLTEKWSFNYEKYGKELAFSKTTYSKLIASQHVALKNAENIFNVKKYLTHSNRNPCTLVFKLVNELNKCLRI